MTNTEFLSATNLPTCSFEQLAQAYAFCAATALSAKSASACSRAMNQRALVTAEAERRGAVIRSNRHFDLTLSPSEVYYMCGYPSDFVAVAA